MNQEEAGRLLYLRCLKIYNNNQDQQKSVRTLHFMLNQFFFQLTRESRVQFTSFFSRIAFVGQAYQFPETLIYDLQWFRKQVLKRLASNSSFSDEFLFEAIRITTDSVFYITKASIPEELSALIPSNSIIERPETRFEGKINSLRVVITDGDPIGRSLLGYEFETSKQVLIRYDVAGINDHFNATVKQIKDLWQHQIMVNLVQINVQADGSLIPEMIILEPDFLIDVTAVARCRDMDRFDHRLSLLQKFQAVPNSLHILLGNIANFFLDELIRKPEQTFESLFKQVFQLNPIGISLFPNHALKQLMSDSRNHYQNLRRVIAQDFPEARINPQDCELEPSFFSAEYGLQGRLDILSIDSEQNELSIVELKSGRPFTKATSTLNLKPDHYVQTLLYDLLIRSVFTDFQDAKKYILYSKLTDQAMRFAPTFKVLQQEALQARNQIIALERQMLLLDENAFDQPNFLDRLDQGGLSLLSRFNRADLERASDQIRSLKPLQRSYFLAFAAFIAREQYFSRVGDGLQNSRTGMARLWLQSPFEKEENFEIFRQLRLQQEQIKEAEPIVLFQKTALTNAMANFRVGDLALIYPMEDETSNALNSRIFRGSIIELEGEWVTFRLRASQSHNHHFQVDSLWNLEPDHYDGSNQLYRNLFEFISMPAQKQNPILGLRPPALPKNLEWEIPENFTAEQKRILKKVLNAEEYFLLLGPPGTGKTKFMLAEMVRQLLKNTKEQILLLAYTNRAVDEICDAIHHFAAESYLRIGKRSSCEAPFRSQLLSDRIKAIGNRSALKTLITQHRIIISTVASMANKSDLWDLKAFDRIIVDEASQILEPAIIHLLSKTKRFVLIGDHKQLPAVVVQSKEQSAVQDENLQKIGLHNRRNSLFERLYRLADKNQWDWAFDMLSHQGRMHRDISDFPNQAFYDGHLHNLPGDGDQAWQAKPLPFSLDMLQGQISGNPLIQTLANHRFLMQDVPLDDRIENPKSNPAEAEAIVRLLDGYRKLYETSNLPLEPESIGVITPYRAQIAQIRLAFDAYDASFTKSITIDTVERYQGGARKIILISFCINQEYQLDSLVSLSDDGNIDRKLNVALTRARQHLVLVGSVDLLRVQPIYNNLIDYLKERNAFIPAVEIEK